MSNNPGRSLAAIVSGVLAAAAAPAAVAAAPATRYGEVLDPGTTEVLDVKLGSETLVDLEGRFDVTERIRVALGAENVFDEYPDAFPISRNTTGNTPFSNYSPFGRSGRFIYGRVSIGF